MLHHIIPYSHDLIAPYTESSKTQYLEWNQLTIT